MGWMKNGRSRGRIQGTPSLVRRNVWKKNVFFILVSLFSPNKSSCTLNLYFVVTTYRPLKQQLFQLFCVCVQHEKKARCLELANKKASIADFTESASTKIESAVWFSVGVMSGLLKIEMLATSSLSRPLQCGVLQHWPLSDILQCDVLLVFSVCGHIFEAFCFRGRVEGKRVQEVIIIILLEHLQFTKQRKQGDFASIHAE